MIQKWNINDKIFMLGEKKIKSEKKKTHLKKTTFDAKYDRKNKYHNL